MPAAINGGPATDSAVGGILSWTVRQPWLLSLFLLATASAAAQQAAELPENGPWAVRAYYLDRAMLQQLADERAIWSVDRASGYALVEARDGADYNHLLNLGLLLEVDVARTRELHAVREPMEGQTTGIPGFPCYPTVEETFAIAENLVANNPDLAEWVDIGDSWEKINTLNGGYDLMVLVLGNRNNPGPKPKLFAMSGMHAREYTPAGLTLRFAEYLIDNYETDADATWLLDYHEIHLLLQANPDGRKRAETGLFWRKNADNDFCGNSNSRGVDLNRNFEFMWNCCGGSSGSACSDVFRGPNAASEPESDAVQEYLRAIFPDQRGPNLSDPAPADATGVFLDIHSFSQLVLWPYGFDPTPAPNGTALQTLGRKFAFFNGYRPEKASVSFDADGATDDFAYGDLGVAAYTFELGTSFFQSCTTFENQILPDNLEALIYAAKAARAPYLDPAGPDIRNPALDAAVYPVGQTATLTAIADDTRYSNANGTEPSQNIAAAEYTLDTPPWEPGAAPVALTAADGAFDGPIENLTVQIDTAGLSPGAHRVYVRGRDADGFWGPVSAAFLRVEQTLLGSLALWPEQATVLDFVPLVDAGARATPVAGGPGGP